MKTANKIILSGFVALLGACSNEPVVPDITGATTEPNSSPTAQLTEEQKAVLARSFHKLIDWSAIDSSKGVPDSSAVGFDNMDYQPISYLTGMDKQIFSYPSKDDRRVCDVVTFTENEAGAEIEGVMRAMSYDQEKYRKCVVRVPDEIPAVQKVPCQSGMYRKDRNIQTLVATKVVVVDETPVVLKAVLGGSYEAGVIPTYYWGYGVTCSEMYNQFKQSCAKSNGLFKDFADGCRDSYLNIACASFVPEGVSKDDVLDYYVDEYRNACYEDSVRYAPFDDENYVPYDRNSDSLFLADTSEKYGIINEWLYNLKQSLRAYRWQFTISNVDYDEFDNLVFDEIDEMEYPEWRFLDSWLSYNTLPNSDIAEAYRKEGVYVLPDSLVEKFFPLVTSIPYGLNFARKYFGMDETFIYYMIVVKDTGSKGHILTDSDANGFYVTDVVKSGNCPEDTTIHYSAFLVVNSPEWDAVGKPIIKTTVASENWNCDKPETLEKIEPYGEWAFFGEMGYYDYVDSDLGKD